MGYISRVVGIAAVKSHEAKPSAISPLYRKRAKYIPEFHDCPCYNILIPWLQRGSYIIFFMLVGDVSRRQANTREVSDIFHFTAIHFLPERHSAMVLIYILHTSPVHCTVRFPMTRSVRYQPIFNGLKFTLHRARVVNNVVITTVIEMV